MQNVTMREVRDFAVPHNSLALWWLGQAGFLIKSPGGTIIALDPYLSNSCKAVGESIGVDMDRLVAPPLAPTDLAGIDAYVLTHSHQDHLDPETLEIYRAAGGIGPYVAPPQTMDKLRALGVPESEIEMTWPKKEHFIGDLQLQTTFAIPFGADDLTHVGYKVRLNSGCPRDSEGRILFYFTGDTAYHEILVNGWDDKAPDAMIAVINPAFRNLGPIEAARLAKQLDASVVIPCHYDLFRDNSVPPQMLRTNLIIEGIGERYRVLEHGKAAVFSGEL